MSIRILLFLLAYCLSPKIGLAQQDFTLHGVAVIQNSKYKTNKVEYVDGVNVWSNKGKSTPQTSDSKGAFSLIFSDVKLGGFVSIEAQKSGYDLVNQEELTEFTVPRYEPAKLVFCSEGALEKNRAKYYNISFENFRVYDDAFKNEAITNKYLI